MVEDNVVEVPFDREHLLEVILSPDNLKKDYKSAIEAMGVEESTRCYVTNFFYGSLLTRKV